MSERFGDMEQGESKFLNLVFFMGKLFTKNEHREVDEVDQTLQLIKAALIYKNVDFGVIFAEKTQEDTGKKGKGKRDRKVKEEKTGGEEQQTNVKLDMMSHYTRFAHQLVKEDFCERVNQIGALNVTPDMIRRLANFLSLNQKNRSVIYLNSWLHHLRRVGTAFNIPNQQSLGIICAKLLANETVFRSLIDTICMLKQKRDEQKFVELADLRTVLRKFGVTYVNQNMFLQEFAQGVAVHIEDLIARMQRCIRMYYGKDPSGEEGAAENASNTSAGFQSLENVQAQSFFMKVAKKMRKAAKSVDKHALIEKCREFDPAMTNQIQVYYFVSVLKHNLDDELFSERELVGLQYELESLSPTQTVDY